MERGFVCMTYPYMTGYFDFNLEYWDQKVLRPGDQFPAVCYAFGIPAEKIIPCVDINDQINFINQEKTRMPKSVLEIGSGRGEVTCSLKKLNIPVTAIDVAIDIQQWVDKTAHHFFGPEFTPPQVIENNIKNVELDLSKYDTIMLVESFEHISEEDFESTWTNICNNFKGLLCITNLLSVWPIHIGGD